MLLENPSKLLSYTKTWCSVAPILFVLLNINCKSPV
jgi:hypothetical protein